MDLYPAARANQNIESRTPIVVARVAFFTLTAVLFLMLFIKPPKWLMSLSILSYTVVIFISASLWLYAFVIYRMLVSFFPSESEPRSAPANMVTPGLERLGQVMTTLGFFRAGSPYIVGKINGVGLLFCNPAHTIYTTASHIEHPMAKDDTIAFISFLKDFQGSLATVNNYIYVPTQLGRLCQVFEGADPPTLFEEHLKALVLLKGETIEPMCVLPKDFFSVDRLLRQKRWLCVKRRVFWISLLMLLHVIFRTKPCKGSVSLQKRWRRHIKNLKHADG